MRIKSELAGSKDERKERNPARQKQEEKKRQMIGSKDEREKERKLIDKKRKRTNKGGKKNKAMN